MEMICMGRCMNVSDNDMHVLQEKIEIVEGRGRSEHLGNLYPARFQRARSIFITPTSSHNYKHANH